MGAVEVLWLDATDFHSSLHGGFDGFITGTITTDGTIGALQPEAILGFDLTAIVCGSGHSLCGSPVEEIGVTGSWTPGSFSATAFALSFDFGPQFTRSLALGPFDYFPACPQAGQCGTFSMLGFQFFIEPFAEIQLIASEGVTVPIPGPIAGAGLPGASGGILGWWRRRKKVA